LSCVGGGHLQVKNIVIFAVFTIEEIMDIQSYSGKDLNQQFEGCWTA
jgi:hypothetical protein